MAATHSRSCVAHHPALAVVIASLVLALPGAVRAAPPATGGGTALAQKEKAEKEKGDSPWLIVPTFSASPKLGFSIGGMVAYMYYFDDSSQVSMFGTGLQYTSTNSLVANLVAKTSFGADHHRLLALLVGGNIKNDYNDFLGTGQPLKSEDQLRAAVMRYQYRVWGDWFVGGQFVRSSYQILGQSALDNEMLQTLGLTGFEGGGIGANVNLDSRDNEFSPRHGALLNFNNIAYRDWIAGKNNYDAYRADLRWYRGVSKSTVLALRQANQWTANAPKSAYAPITLRGYKFGQYLGQYMSSLEAETRVGFAHRWTTTLFAGVGGLYGGALDLSDSENIYPDVGAGVQFVLKQDEGMVLNLEYAKGKGDNQGVYMKFGYGF